MTAEINIDTAYEWLKRRYKDVPRIWTKFDQTEAAESLVDAVHAYNLSSYDDLPARELMCIMAESYCP